MSKVSSWKRQNFVCAKGDEEWVERRKKKTPVCR